MGFSKVMELKFPTILGSQNILEKSPVQIQNLYVWECSRVSIHSFAKILYLKLLTKLQAVKPKPSKCVSCGLFVICWLALHTEEPALVLRKRLGDYINAA